MSKEFSNKLVTVIYDGLVATNRYNFNATEVEYEIVEGPGQGSKGKSECEWKKVSEGLYMISWQEKSGATVVHLDDFINGTSMTYFTTNENIFYRLDGTLCVSHC